MSRKACEEGCEIRGARFGRDASQALDTMSLTCFPKLSSFSTSSHLDFSSP